ncbi:nuclear transport factor 2 family protein [Pseudozobellia thermophila]|uniref:SnoaL-like polyketide cyclase n=1 Tax=Pseudozobellia thermophila TaxID=192903 RepID=A0A1M6ENT6_9FLAO|nr:nuclear transport factor 2 family protein [Pseudozobellia thermophila]SHI87083.1 SnoaL-like polyketide cyclase [Pseudozobellia thermophila]
MKKEDITANEKTVIEFLKMLENRKSSNELDRFYHPEAQQIEFPNALTKQTTTRSLQELKEASEKGAKILSKESYEIKNLLPSGHTVVLECVWRGTLAVPVGAIKAGGQMVAYFAQVFEFKEGKIFRQRNYDCFEPFS